MAKLPRTGVSYQMLDERKVTLEGIIESQGLKRLSKKAARVVRDRLGFALSMWDEPHTALQVKDVANALRTHAKRLDQIGALATATRPGFARTQEIAVSTQLVQVLASDPEIGSVEAAHKYLRNFCDMAGTIALRCRDAVGSLQSRKGHGGKAQYGWYDEFTAVLLAICKSNKIKPTVGIDRVSGEPVGSLPKIASSFERLLPPKMRSRKPATMVKRLQRSVGRLQAVTQSASGGRT
jgi:hypothetical protein